MGDRGDRDSGPGARTGRRGVSQWSGFAGGGGTSGLPGPAEWGILAGFSKFRLRVLPAMEINPILNSIKDLSERTQTIRGYL